MSYDESFASKLMIPGMDSWERAVTIAQGVGIGLGVWAFFYWANMQHEPYAIEDFGCGTSGLSCLFCDP